MAARRTAFAKYRESYPFRRQTNANSRFDPTDAGTPQLNITGHTSKLLKPCVNL